MSKIHIVRIFRAEAKRGKEKEFREFFLNYARPLLESTPGVLSVQVGLPMSENERTFTMITTWQDLSALKAFSGDQWHKAVIDPREAPLLENVEVFHYREVLG